MFNDFVKKFFICFVKFFFEKFVRNINSNCFLFAFHPLKYRHVYFNAKKLSSIAKGSEINKVFSSVSDFRKILFLRLNEF